MISKADIIKDTYANLGLPPQKALSLVLVDSFIHQALRFYYAGLELSDQNQTVKEWGFTPTEKDMEVSNSLAFGKAALAEAQMDDDGNEWEPVAIVNLADIDTYDNAGQLAIAFYGTPARIRFSWDPTVDFRNVRIWYDSIIAMPQTNDESVSLPDYYVSMVAARVSLDALPTLLEKMPDLAQSLLMREVRLQSKLNEWERLWTIWKCTGHQQARTIRPAFNRNRIHLYRG